MCTYHVGSRIWHTVSLIGALHVCRAWFYPSAEYILFNLLYSQMASGYLDRYLTCLAQLLTQLWFRDVLYETRENIYFRKIIYTRLACQEASHTVD